MGTSRRTHALRGRQILGRFTVLVTTSLTDPGRQGANSAVRFTTYTTLKQFAVQSRTRTGQILPSNVTFGVGAIAGLVYITTSLDVIKTRLQSLEARAQYRNSLHCAYRIFTEEGL
ncbi:hypothetical protein EDB92DRAFT_1804770 [Lactarius akahatsu]|uniref:Uncharacterized protein n=1 Tax=Lactarius akahatsu TaxID=416441 RepID=A0AAD4L6D2_9AGAM|nr:hypothetical protein EDB92DRAFT_1804770 [Lactarius akahatsu]